MSFVRPASACASRPRSRSSHGTARPQGRSCAKGAEREAASDRTAREKLARREEEDEVLVRNTPGPTVEIFQAATDYCGRVNAEALDLDLRPCSACAPRTSAFLSSEAHRPPPDDVAAVARRRCQADPLRCAPGPWAANVVASPVSRSLDFEPPHAVREALHSHAPV